MRALIAALALCLLAGPAWAEDATSNYDHLQQVQLTEAQVKGYIESMPDMQAAIGDAPADAAEPDAKTMAKLESIAQKHGFKSFDEFNSVAGNISLVLDGVDPQTKTYVGADKLIEKSIKDVQTDTQMKEADRKAALVDLEAQEKAAPKVQFAGNVELVVKNYDRLTGGDGK